MKCEMCSQLVELTREGRYQVHQIRTRGRDSYCPYSGEQPISVPIIRLPLPKELFAC